MFDLMLRSDGRLNGPSFADYLLAPGSYQTRRTSWLDASEVSVEASRIGW